MKRSKNKNTSVWKGLVKFDFIFNRWLEEKNESLFTFILFSFRFLSEVNQIRAQYEPSIPAWEMQALIFMTLLPC